MTLLDLLRSGQLLWGVFLLIALVFLFGSLSRYQRSRARADLPRVLTDLMAILLVALAILHLALGVPHSTPLLIVYAAGLGGLFVYRLWVVNQVTMEVEARQKAMSEASRAASALSSQDPQDPG